MNSIQSIAFALFVTITGCDSYSPSSTSDAHRSKRVFSIAELLKKRVSIPGEILDASYIEEQKGNGRIGPSDFFFFAKLTVARKDFNTWKSIAGKEINHWDYLAPIATLTWWPTKAEANELEMYSPEIFFGRSNGWIGFSDDGQSIYALTFTM